MGELSRRVSSTTGVKVEIGSPTKICDFKPAFGQIFRDYLNTFEFWGYCDLDVVWGDLSYLVKDNILAKYDIVSVRGDQFLSGACTFYRNTHDLRTLYKMSPTWKEVFEDPDHWAFDEDFGRGEARSLDVLRSRGEPVSMLDIATNEIEERNLSFYTPDPPYVIQELEPTFEFSLSWNEGTLTENEKGEVLAFHFLFAKKNPFFRIPHWTQVPSLFAIDSRGVYSSSTNIPAYESARLSKGGFRWCKQTLLQKIHNARVKISSRFSKYWR